MALSKDQKKLIDKDFWIMLIISNSPYEAAQIMLGMGEGMSNTPDLAELGDVADRLIAAGKKNELYNRLILLRPDWDDIPHDTRTLIDAHLYTARQKNYVGPPMEDGSYVSNTGSSSQNNWMDVIGQISQVLTPLIGQVAGQGQTQGQQQTQQQPTVVQPQKWYQDPVMAGAAVIGGLAFLGLFVWGIIKLKD